MKHLHIVNPYGSAAMIRMSQPLINELAKLYTVTTDAEMNVEADAYIHMPYHTLAGDFVPSGKHIIAYTHCNPGALPQLMLACARADIVTAMSFTGRQELLDFGVDPKKIWVIPCAADNFHYRPRRVLIVGYPQPNARKREHILFDLAYKYDLTPFEFYLAGGGWEEIAPRLGVCGIAGQVVRPVDDNKLAEFYHTADVLLVTGYVEGGPLPILEAMASGTRVLSPRFGYAADYLDEENLYDGPDELMAKLHAMTEQSIYYHQLARAWGWADYCAEYALLIGRLLGESVDLYPERGMSRYAQLLDVIDEIKPRAICEIGTWNGNRAIQMLQEAGKYHQSKRLQYQGFDLFEHQTGEQFIRELSKVGQPQEIVQKRIEVTGARVRLIAGETQDTLQLNIGFTKDFIFVDGGHSEETIENDGNIALQILDFNSKTVIVFDDYYHEGKPEGFGCNAFIDGLNPDIYEVTHLPALTLADDGRLIGMVKVRRNNAAIRVQLPTESQAGSATRDDGKPPYYVSTMQISYAPGPANTDG
jgi:hypothetical protein